MKVGKSIVMDDRLLYQTVYFDNKITFFFRFVNFLPYISSQNSIVFGTEQYLSSRYLCLNVNSSLNLRI